MNTTISVLGCGWLGAPLAVELVQNGYRVFSSNKTPETIINEIGVSPFVIDISKNNQDYPSFLASDTLIIAIPHDVVEDYERLITQIERSGIKQVLLISTAAVYPMLNGVVTEKTPTIASVRSEIEGLFLNHPSFTTTVLRFGGLFGYNRQPGNFFKPGSIIDHPEGYVNMIHRDDCIRVILEILRQNRWGHILNAVADSHPTRREFYTKTAAAIGRTDLVFNEASENQYKIVSNERLKELLDFEFKTGDLMAYEGNERTPSGLIKESP